MTALSSGQSPSGFRNTWSLGEGPGRDYNRTNQWAVYARPYTLTHTHTRHRPHAAPKGQEETLIRGGRATRTGREDRERGYRGARAGTEDSWPGRSGALTFTPPAQALYWQGDRLALQLEDHQTAPEARGCLVSGPLLPGMLVVTKSALSPARARWLSAESSGSW